jgi:O-antigen/teichoic acid export membrane protein
MKVSRDSGDVEAILAVWLDMVRRMALFVLPAFALLLVIGNQLMVTLYGQRYAESGLVFTIFVFHLLRYVAPYGVIPRVYGETVFILRVSLFALLATVVALFVCTYLWGYVGAAVANVLSVYFISWPQVVKSNRLLGVHPGRFLPWAALARVSGVSALAAAALLAVRPLLRGPDWLQLLGMCGLFGGLYLGGLVISGELKRTRV